MHFQAFKEKEKEKNVIENIPVETPSRDHPEGAVDLDVLKIASENLTTSHGLGAVETVPDVTSDDVDEEDRAEV
jgi:hypothetical protein